MSTNSESKTAPPATEAAYLEWAEQYSGNNPTLNPVKVAHRPTMIDRTQGARSKAQRTTKGSGFRERMRAEKQLAREAAKDASGPEVPSAGEKRARGQQGGEEGVPTKRPKVSNKVIRRVKPCFEYTSTGSCARGDACNYTHDLEGYLKEKEPDLGPRCVVFETLGRCRMGFRCRFLGAHLDPKTQQLVTKPEVKVPPPSVNIFTRELSRKLKRRGKFKTSGMTFSRAKAICEAHKKSKKLFHKLKQAAIAQSSAESKNAEKPAGPQLAVVQPTPDTKTSSDTAKPAVGATDIPLKLVCPVASPPTAPSTTPRPSKPGSQEAPKAPLSAASRAFQILQSSDTKTGGLVNNGDGFGYLASLARVEPKPLDLRNKLILAPLTTVGNLPFRRICVDYGADVTVSEMAVAKQLLKGNQSEWSLLRRHPSEKIFGVQIAGKYMDTVTSTVELLNHECSYDFIDLNAGCPIDGMVDKGMGSALMNRKQELGSLLRGIVAATDKPVTVKMRAGFQKHSMSALRLLELVHRAGVSGITIHGRTRQQRYSRLADWQYIRKCADYSATLEGGGVPIFGNGDVYTYQDYERHMSGDSKVAGVMIARGALVKPWIFTEIKERKNWDISPPERLSIIESFVRNGLEHWGSDTHGVTNTRRFLLEWLSFQYRYIPVGVLENGYTQLNWHTQYVPRTDLERKLGSADPDEWIRISEMFLGKVPKGFVFQPKHRARAKDPKE